MCPKKTAKKRKTKKKSPKKGGELEKAGRSRDIRDILKRLGEKIPEEPASKEHSHADDDYYFGDKDYASSE